MTIPGKQLINFHCQKMILFKFKFIYADAQRDDTGRYSLIISNESGPVAANFRVKVKGTLIKQLFRKHYYFCNF